MLAKPADMTSAAADPAASSRTIALIVAAAFFMETLDGTVVITALPTIASSFGTVSYTHLDVYKRQW